MMTDKNKQFRKEWEFDLGKVTDRVVKMARNVSAKAEEQVKHERFVAVLGNAQRAKVDIGFSVGTSVVKSISTENAMEAELTYVGDIEFDVQGDEELNVKLRQAGSGAGRNFFGWAGSGQKLRWDIGLTDQIPLDLRLHGGVGKSELDLQNLQISALRMSGGAGETNAILAGGVYQAQVDCGVGKTTMVLPHSAEITLDVNCGTGEYTLEVGENVALNARINGGVGAVNIRLPQGAAVRLIGNRGIGSIRVPDYMARIDGGDIWQTVNYETAERKITLHYNGGVGTLKLV